MADKNLEVKLRITADGKAAVSGLRQIDGALDEIGDSAVDSTKDIGGFFDEFSDVGKAAVGLNQLAELVGKLSGAAREVADLADSYRSLQARIASTLGSQEAGNAAMAQLVELAKDTHAPLQSTAELFARLARATKETGTSQKDLLGFVESVNNAMRLNGTRAQEAAGALLQLSQALGSGALRGEEFNSVNEQMPALLDAVAAKLGKPRAELKELAKQGELTSQVLLDSVLAMRDEWAAAAAELPVTWEQALTDVETAWAQHLGNNAAVTGSLDALSGGLVTVAENLDTLVPLAATAGGALAGLKVAKTLNIDMAAAAASTKALTASLPGLISGSTSAAAAAASLAIAEKESAVAALASAKAKQTSAAAALAEAQAHLVDIKSLSVYGEQRAAAERRVAAAKAAHATTTTALAGAEKTHALAATAATAATAKMGLGARSAAASMGLLNKSMALLGGPAGAILVAVSALTAWSFSTAEAEDATNSLSDRVSDLRKNIADFDQEQITRSVRDLKLELKSLEEQLEDTYDFIYFTGGEQKNVIQSRLRKAIDEVTVALTELEDQQKKVIAVNEKAATATEQLSSATENQNRIFSLFAQELQHLNQDGLDAFVVQLTEARAALLLTEPQFIKLLDVVDKMRSGAEQGANAFAALANAIKSAANAEELLGQLQALNQAYAEGSVNAGEYAQGQQQVAERTAQLTATTKEGVKAEQEAALSLRGEAEARQEATDAQRAQNEEMGGGLVLLRFMTDHVEQTAAAMRKLSEQSENLFRTWLEATRGQEVWSVAAIESMARAGSAAAQVTEEIDSVSDAIRQANQDLQFAGGELSEWFKRVELQALQIERAFLQQKQGAEATLAQLEQLDSASETAIAQAQGMVDSYQLLDRQTLSSLEREVERLTRANERLEDSATAALRRYQDLIDQQLGNELAIAERERADALLDLEEQIAAARAAGNLEVVAQLENALRLARQYHTEEIRRLEERLRGEQAINAERNAAADTGAETGDATPPLTTLPARIDPVDIDNLGGRVAEVLAPVARTMQDMTEQTRQLVQVTAAAAENPPEISIDGLVLARIMTTYNNQLEALRS